jgi:hypothetical protein
VNTKEIYWKFRTCNWELCGTLNIYALLDLRQSNWEHHTLLRKTSFDVLGTRFSWDILGNLGKQFKYTLNISKRISGESHKCAKETYGNKFGHEFA